MKNPAGSPWFTSICLALCSLLVFYPISAIAATTTGIVSIEYSPGYLAQRDCVQSALWSGRNNAGPSNIVIWLGCTNLLDSCFCRDDLASSASSLLTSGINSFCSTDSMDVASGVSIYNSYCSRTGTMTLGYVAATTTSSSNAPAVTVTATQTVSSSAAPGLTPLSPREFLLVLICLLAIFVSVRTPFMS